MTLHTTYKTDGVTGLGRRRQGHRRNKVPARERSGLSDGDDRGNPMEDFGCNSGGEPL
jgi:hypothetical protein